MSILFFNRLKMADLQFHTDWVVCFNACTHCNTKSSNNTSFLGCTSGIIPVLGLASVFTMTAMCYLFHLYAHRPYNLNNCANFRFADIFVVFLFAKKVVCCTSVLAHKRLTFTLKSWNQASVQLRFYHYLYVRVLNEALQRI